MVDADKIISYVNRRTSVIHFLAMLLFFVVLLVVFVQPVHILDYTEQNSTVTPLLQVTIIFAVGYAVVLISRGILMYTTSRRSFSTAGVTIWLFAELIVCVAFMSLTAWALCGFGKLMLAQLAGDFTLFMLACEIIPYVVSYLLFLLWIERNEIERLKSLLPSEPVGDSSTLDTNVKFFDKGGRLALATLRSNILFIEAANNYANIHFINDDKEETFILHNSLKELEQQFRNSCLVRCHRGYIVNVDNISLMRKDGTGFQVELIGTQRTIPVTKTYSDALTSYIHVE